jgi:hypothetical protein
MIPRRLRYIGHVWRQVVVKWFRWNAIMQWIAFPQFAWEYGDAIIVPPVLRTDRRGDQRFGGWAC